jgi:hypothetical protein
VSSEELKLMTSISAVQTKGLKRRWNDEGTDFNPEDLTLDNLSEVNNKPKKLNSVAGSKKRRRLLAVMNSLDVKKKICNPNIVTIEVKKSNLFLGIPI